MTRTKRSWGKNKPKGNSDVCLGPLDDNDDEGRDNREEFNGELHKGSFTLEELKSCEGYSRRIDNSDAPKRKWALNFGYLGSKYQGLQVNPDANTVEKHLEKALFLAGGIVESNYANLHKIQWTRTARTDRGVHAVMQCCAMKLSMPLDGRVEFMKNVNSFLPSDIKMHSLSKVTKNFNSKMHCSKRRYHYLLPTYMLQDKAVILDALGAASVVQGPIVDCARAGGYAELGSDKFLGPEALQLVRETLNRYRVDAPRIELLREALKCYVGTKMYHNFTTGKHPTDANARRYIISFTCGEPFVEETSGAEWVLISVVGQSFLLNQIRKMIGLAAEVATGHARFSMMKDALSKQKVEIPMAPGLGLYLDEVFFEGYNGKQENELKFISKQDEKKAKKEKKGGTETEGEGEERSLGEALKWSEEESAIASMDNFRKEFIWPHIFREDKENVHFLYYMDYMRVFQFNFHLKEFKDRVPDRNERKCGEKNDGNDGAEERDVKKMKIENDDAYVVHEEAAAVVPVIVTSEDSVVKDSESGITACHDELAAI